MTESSDPLSADWRRGFILTEDWQDTAGDCRATFWGRGEDGVFALHASLRPVLFVPQRVVLPEGVTVAERRSLTLRSFQRHPVDALYFLRQRDLLDARDLLRQAGVPVFEGDVGPCDRFRMERFIHASCAFAGPCRIVEGVRHYDHPRLQRADYRPRLSRMAFDIETGSARQLYALSIHFVDGAVEERQVFIAGFGRRRRESPTHYCHDAAGALRAFLDAVRRLDPDLLCGWNIVGFDLPFLQAVADETGVPLALGRDGGLLRLTESGNGRWHARLPGRVVLDGIQALKGSFFDFDDYRLETVARAVLGEGKLIATQGSDKQAEIDRLFREDKERLAEYNLRDSELVNGIIEKTALLDLLISRSLVSGMLLDRIGRSVAAFDHFFLPRLHRKGFVAPDRGAGDTPEALPGGLVLPSRPGLHAHVAVFDFRSLYPSIIRTFRICPYAWIMADTHPVRTPTGSAFSDTEHILPGYIEELMAVRARAKSEGHPELAQAVKILMNSFYGVMGAPASRFYNPVLPISITATGQWILRTAQAHLEGRGLGVLYGDTDSLFVRLREADLEAPHAACERLAAEVTAFFAEELRADFHVVSALQLEFQRYYRRLYLPHARNPHLSHSDETDGDAPAEGAAKRYAGLAVHPDGRTELLATGLECVRSDWTPLAQRVQRELLRRVFEDQPVDSWLRAQIRELRAGGFDGELVYRRRMRKAPASYTHAQPPHVRAARLLPAERQTGVVSYVMTCRGPVPVELPHADVDYAHYEEKQIRPVVEDLLGLQGRTFDEVCKDEQQLRLW